MDHDSRERGSLFTEFYSALLILFFQCTITRLLFLRSVTKYSIFANDLQELKRYTRNLPMARRPTKVRRDYSYFHFKMHPVRIRPQKSFPPCAFQTVMIRRQPRRGWKRRGNGAWKSEIGDGESLIHVHFDRLHSLSLFDNGRIMRNARIRPHRLGQEMHYCV